MNTAALQTVLRGWSGRGYHLDALKEGWCLVLWRGRRSEVQVQRIDDPERVQQEFSFHVPELADDKAAWLRVRTGTGKHHEAARKLLAEHSPHEWRQICEEVDKVTAAFAKERADAMKSFDSEFGL